METVVIQNERKRSIKDILPTNGYDETEIPVNGKFIKKIRPRFFYGRII